MDKNNKLLFAGVLLLPAVVWGLVIGLYGVDVPWFDDFDPFPDFLRQWIGNDSLSNRLSLLVKPNNEHRMVFGKLAAIASYVFFGRLDFLFLQAVGACFTLGTFALLWGSFRSSGLKLWYFLPVAFLLFQFQYYLVFIWSICSLQHQPVIFFVCLSIFLLSRNKFLGGLIAAWCATFAMSNGIFVWAGGAAVLLLRLNLQQLTIWVFAGILAVGLYFYGMSAQGNESSLDFLIENPHLSVLGFLTFLGGLFDFFPWLRIEYRSALPVLMSSLILIWLSSWLVTLALGWMGRYTSWFKELPTWTARLTGTGSPLTLFSVGVLVFLLSNALIIGLLRPRFGFFVMLVSNYKIYPALFLSLTYLAFLASDSMAGVVFKWIFSGSIFIWALSVFNYLPTISERRKYLLVNAYNQEHNAFGLGHIPFSKGAEYIDTLMKYMTSNGLYRYPQSDSFIHSEINRMKRAGNDKMGLNWTVDDRTIHLDDPDSGFSFGYNDGMYPYIMNEKYFYIFKMDQNIYSGRSPLRQFDKGSTLDIPLSTLRSGSYRLGVMRIEGDEVQTGILGAVVVP